LAQSDLKPAGAVAALMNAKDLDQRRFPDRRTVPHRLLLVLLPGTKAGGWHAQRLAEPPHGVVAALRIDEAVGLIGPASVGASALSRRWQRLFLKSPVPVPVAGYRLATGTIRRPWPGPEPRPTRLPPMFEGLSATV